MSPTKKILLADDDNDLLAALTIRCQALHLEVLTARDGVAALNIITSAIPDLLCVDVSMPGIEGLTLCEWLRADTRFGSLPIIVLTGQQPFTVVQRCHQSCAYYVPKGQGVWSRIEPLLVELLGLGTTEDVMPVSPSESSSQTAIEEPSPPWVLCIEDDDDLSRSLQLRLEAHGIAVVRAASGMDGYRSAYRYPADAIILDYNLPDGRGDYVLRRLKENPLTEAIPVIVVTGVQDRSVERRLRNMGAVSYLTKPLMFSDLLTELGRHIDVLSAAAI